MSSYDFEPRCGCMDCSNPKAAEVEIPGKGTRAVCEAHLEDLEVNSDV